MIGNTTLADLVQRYITRSSKRGSPQGSNPTPFVTNYNGIVQELRTSMAHTLDRAVQQEMVCFQSLVSMLNEFVYFSQCSATLSVFISQNPFRLPHIPY